MSKLRLIIGAALGFVVTAALFVIMPTLIETADKSLNEKEATRIADIAMPDREIEERLEEEKPDKPEEPEEPPPDVEQPEMENPEVENAVNMSPGMQVELSGISGTGLGGGEGDYLPIVKVAPIYPRRAQSRGVEGYCIVEYTVTKSGAIRDPKAVDCEPGGYFERASVKAAEKFKYKPRVVDGEPIAVSGVRNKFTYELEE